MNRTADGDSQLVPVDHSGKCPTLPLPVGSQHEEIPILGENNSAEFEGPLQKLMIIPVGSSIFLGGEHVDLPLSQAGRYGHRHVVVQIEAEAH